MGNNEGQQQEKNDYELVNEFAERLGLDDKEKDSFVTSSMKRLGWKPRTQWEPPEPEGNGDDGDDGDFFSGKRKEREQRQVRGGGSGGSGERQQSSGGWQYGD